MCAGRFVDAQDNLDGMPRRAPIDEWSTIFTDGADHIGNLQSMTSDGERGGIGCRGPRIVVLLTILWTGPVSTHLLFVVAGEVQVGQIVVLDYRRAFVTKDLNTCRNAGIGTCCRRNRPKCSIGEAQDRYSHIFRFHTMRQ